MGPHLEELHERLAGVVIENKDWLDILDLYDRPSTLFYLDPPYWGCENDYGRALFSRDQFEIMATRLACLQGRFILSLNDVPEVREIFRAFLIEAVSTQYSIATNSVSTVGEVLISNVRLQVRQTSFL